MSPQQRNNSDVVKEYEDDLKPGELEDLLAAVRTLKRGSGWGNIELTYLGAEVNDIDIHIKRKPKKQKPV
jgi:hypothetical protein